MGCENCNERNENRFTFESAMAMAERTIKRLWIIIVLLISIFVGTNLAWIIYENSFQDISIEQEADADDGGVAFNSNGGKVTYYGGESNPDN